RSSSTTAVFASGSDSRHPMPMRPLNAPSRGPRSITAAQGDTCGVLPRRAGASLPFLFVLQIVGGVARLFERLLQALERLGIDRRFRIFRQFLDRRLHLVEVVGELIDLVAGIWVHHAPPASRVSIRANGSSTDDLRADVTRAFAAADRRCGGDPRARGA